MVLSSLSAAAASLTVMFYFSQTIQLFNVQLVMFIMAFLSQVHLLKETSPFKGKILS